MKHAVPLSLLFAASLLAAPAMAHASEPNSVISVVIPSGNAKQASPAPPAQKRDVYPASVWEQAENGRREIIRAYELNAQEKPEDIPRESFTREGWLYELADITRRETANADSRQHTETVAIETASNDMPSIAKLLAPEIEYQSEDGYYGILSLDPASIAVETAGVRSSSHTVSATREYMNLPSNDTAQIPKTITDKGRVLELSAISWSAQDYSAVDHAHVANSYSAVASYTGTATATVVSGYSVTAGYSGRVSRVLPGRTVYTARFIGVQIVTAIKRKSDAAPGAAHVEILPEAAAEPQPAKATPEPSKEPPRPDETLPEPATEPPPADESPPELEPATEPAEPPPTDETLPEPTDEPPAIPAGQEQPAGETGPPATAEAPPPNTLPLVLLAVLIGAGAGCAGVILIQRLLARTKNEE